MRVRKSPLDECTLSKMADRYTIGEVRNSEWLEVAKLVAQAIPNALNSKLGNRFGAAFYGTFGCIRRAIGKIDDKP